MPKRRMALPRIAALCAMMTAVAGCRDQNAPFLPPERGSALQYVTGDAALALNQDGTFRLEPAQVWQRQELDEQVAAGFADVHAATLVPTLGSIYERNRGLRIDFERLRRCGPAFYAESPYEEPNPQIPQGLVNAASSRWLFSYCDPDIPAISIAVATSATHLRVVNGQFDPMSMRGGEFDTEGIPVRSTAPMYPERAVERLATESKKRIANVPHLVLPGVGYFAQSARWLLDLEDEVQSRGPNGDVRVGRTFFVGRSLRAWENEISRSQSQERSADTLFAPKGAVFVFVRRAERRSRWEKVTLGGR